MVERNEAPRGLVMHGFGAGSEQVTAAFRSAGNAAKALPGAVIELVIQGPAVAALVIDGELAAPVAAALGNGVAVLACENSMRSAGVDRGSLLPGVASVPSAVAHLAQRQWDNWAYARV
ncbi:hypothetical protein AL755_16470 [Arthrobacter sp. ERGS1:01]|uniref:DsrE family protein n=1 Tax=Arthrobacter sp. ERGS1:01 TaxID=1704044 RepID=UPI0006B5F5B5|nr:hypothetical protein [Arthrobacter sp. ERGS1:01]ALE06682.1 hypothetical protein AL755_16470 [Arthrobacter sp. ERGS1:01]